VLNGIHMIVLKFLLSCDANPDTANNAGLTPGHLAKSKECLSLLYESGAHLYCIDSKARLPVAMACSIPPTVGAVGGTHTHADECVAYLCSVTPYEFLFWPDENGDTCLHIGKYTNFYYKFSCCRNSA
jgi:hypothetical protein